MDSTMDDKCESAEMDNPKRDWQKILQQVVLLGISTAVIAEIFAVMASASNLGWEDRQMGLLQTMAILLLTWSFAFLYGVLSKNFVERLIGVAFITVLGWIAGGVFQQFSPVPGLEPSVTLNAMIPSVVAIFSIASAFRAQYIKN